jgi:multiple sugar transport system substrate-binding protein
MKKNLAYLMFVFLLILFLAACGTKSDSDETSTEKSTENQPVSSEAPKGTKGTLEIWSMFTGADGAAFPDIVDMYNATNPDYQVVHRAIEANDLYLKLQLAVASGEGIPDMAMNHIERMPLFQEEGKLTDLSPYLAVAGINKEDYNAKGWEMTDLAGGHYGVPLDVHSYILWVNMDLYEKYGLTDLDDGVLTWEEFEKTAEVVKKDSIIPMGLSWLRPIFLASYAQLGGTLSEDGTAPSFNNDIAKQVLTHYTNMVKAGNSQVEGVDSWKEFTAGNVLYMPEGVWMTNAVNASGLNIKAFDFPVFDASKKGNWTSSHQITIPANPKLDPERIKASLDFIKFVGENSIGWAAAGLVPSHVSVANDDSFKQLPQAFLANENKELKIYDYKYYGLAVESLDKVLGDIFFNKISIEDGLKQASTETKDRIELGQ